MVSSRFLSSFRLRSWFAFAATVLLLAACGGGGGAGEPLFPGAPAFQGTWQLDVTIGGVTSAPVTVPASAVPTERTVAEFDTDDIADLVGATRFQGYTVSVSGSTITVTDPDTNYVVVINSIATANYAGCGNCLVGTSVSFDVSVNATESGTLDGVLVGPVTTTTVLRFRYTRTV